MFSKVARTLVNLTLTSHNHPHADPQSEQKISRILMVFVIVMITSIIMTATCARKLKKDLLLGGGANSIGTWFL